MACRARPASSNFERRRSAARSSRRTSISPGPQFSGNAVKSVEDAAARVRQQKSEGWDLLKVQEGLALDVYDSMAKTAKEVGIRFGGHVPDSVDVIHALDMGQETFDHIDGYIEHLDGRAKVVDDKALQDLVLRTRKAGAWIVPTMVVWETLQGPVTLESRTSLPELQYMPATQVAQWTKALETRLKNPQFNAPQAKLHIDNRIHIMKALHAGGVRLLLGSDAPQQFNVPGYSIHREMKSMADAGITPYDVIKSGTANVGEYFKAQDTFGIVAAGQRADLILVDANPLQNVTNMEKRSGRDGSRPMAAGRRDRRTAGEDRRRAMRRPMFPADSYPLARRDILTLAGLASISPFALARRAGAEPSRQRQVPTRTPARALRAARRPPGAQPAD